MQQRFPSLINAAPPHTAVLLLVIQFICALYLLPLRFGIFVLSCLCFPFSFLMSKHLFAVELARNLKVTILSAKNDINGLLCRGNKLNYDALRELNQVARGREFG